MMASTSKIAPMVKLKARCLRGSCSKLRIETPNKAHRMLHGVPTSVPMLATNSALLMVLIPLGMKTDARVTALTQLLGFSA